MAKRAKKIKRMYLDVSKGHYLDVPWTNGRANIDIMIQECTKTAKHSKRGKPFECYLSTGIENFALANPDSIGHEVKHAYVEGSVVYLIDRLKPNGQPAHAYRYLINTSIPDRFDTLTTAKFLERFGKEGFKVTLRLPKRGGAKGTARDVGRPRAGVKKNSQLPRGALRRAMAAGINVGLAGIRKAA